MFVNILAPLCSLIGLSDDTGPDVKYRLYSRPEKLIVKAPIIPLARAYSSASEIVRHTHAYHTLTISDIAL